MLADIKIQLLVSTSSIYNIWTFFHKWKISFIWETEWTFVVILQKTRGCIFLFFIRRLKNKKSNFSCSNWHRSHLSKIPGRNCPGGPVVKISPSNAGSTGLIPGGGDKISHASRSKKQNIKQKQYCNKFNKILKMIHIKKKS